ncbi:MAG TPA: serine hydrolase domain-containing protein [candidate division Zixibacteria bacterium]|nr:beta-lactamase family protein [candidate division Zixibacteria bacterium]MDD4917944.1 serine hydrolase [candidate division Zixibacteria bacterium]MDM7972504.1 serine hydrolase domain-containing protein [candidate division Zixibacteria bacterium]HPM38182.1 serine hydrolase domain-containing protein [candidate division Zixibacteria bacterium]HQL23828.1 serine hydrolase domain-containing protein [candidate division Zixibacteria bacterium]
MNRPLVVLLALACAVAPAVASADPAAPTALPDTPAGRCLAEFVSALNSSDSAQWIAFLAQHPPADANDSATVQERRFGLMRTVHGDFGGLDPVKVLESSEYFLSVILRGRVPVQASGYLRLAFTVTDQPPHRWVRMEAEMLDEDPFAPPPPRMESDEQLAAWVDSVVTAMAAAGQFSGAILLAKDGVPFYSRAVGPADRCCGAPNLLDTKFNLGSMNKMFTGVAIARLAQEGKLAFEDPLIRYLPDYPDREAAAKVTIHQLLTHTAGVDDYWEELFDTSFWEIKSVDGYYQLIKDKPLRFEPGTQYRYSNGGPILLGVIIERITGQSYYDYVRDHIFRPAGMINTDCYEVDVPTPNLAIGYTRLDYSGRRDTVWRANYFMHAVKGGPAGGGYSTVEDLLAFDRALRSYRLLNQAFTDTVLAGRVAMEPGPVSTRKADEMYAYLFGDMRTNGHRIVGHSGGAPGINAVLEMYWDDGYTVAVMANIDEAASTLAARIRRVLTQP